MTSDTKKEFLQKYMLDSYSRAIPTSALPARTATLGDYCEPVDSCKNNVKKRSTEDSDDSDPGYALPQDAIETRMNSRDNLSSADNPSGESTDVYYLAGNPASPPEGYDVPPPKKSSPKPSPKPRSSMHRKSQVAEPVSLREQQPLQKAPSWDGPDSQTLVTDPAGSSIGGDPSSKRRPGKKVVEIDYECASDLRYPLQKTSSFSPASTKPSTSPHHSPPLHKDNDGKTAHKSPTHRRSSAPPVPPPSIPQVPAVGPQSSKAGPQHSDSVYSMSQAIPPTAESMYEEPWDLKAKRLKQKEEARASKVGAVTRADSTAGGTVAPPGMVIPSDHAVVQNSANVRVAEVVKTPSTAGIMSDRRTSNRNSSSKVGAGNSQIQAGGNSSTKVGAGNSQIQAGGNMSTTKEGAGNSQIQAGGNMSTTKEGASNPQNQAEAIYEDAWDSIAQQKKLEARLSYARSLSTTSETSDIFHDALDNVPKSERQSQPSMPPIPADTYEDAWDLKNTMLDQKIRQMQVQASVTYEEPWDLKRQHQQLQARKLSNAGLTSGAGNHVGSNGGGDGGWITGSGSSGSGSSKVVKQRSSECYDQAWSGDSHGSPSVRSKQHSVDDPARTKAKLRGCNIGQRINPMIPLANQNWYHGNITRDDAEKMLRVCREGSYIVRISSDRKSYSLSIKSAKQNIHVQIEQVGLLDGSVRYILGKNSKEFCSIPEMIDYYTHHRVPLKGAEHITLLHPVECKWSSNNPA